MDQTAASSVTTAARWAADLGVPANVFREAIAAVTDEPVNLVVVRWRGSSRRIEARTGVTMTRKRTLELALSPLDFDAWQVDPVHLQRESLRLVCCPSCGGSKNVTCGRCSGTAVATCAMCGGAGRVVGARGRWINCRSCRGQGQARCACRDGVVACPTCDGKGRCNHWLEVVEEPFAREVALGDVRLRSGGAVERSEATHPFGVPLGGENGALLADPRLAQRWASGDRVTAIDIQRFRSVVHRVGYDLAGTAGAVKVQGWDGAIEGNPDLHAVSRWRRMRWLAAGAGLIAGLLLLAFHVSRGGFYVWSLQTLGLALAVGVFIFEGRRMFSALSVKRLRARAGKRRLGEMSGAVMVTLLLLVSRRPDFAHAMELEGAGRTTEAIREYEALARTPDAARAESRLDRITVADLGRLPAGETWSAVEASRFRTAAGRAEARSMAERRTLAMISEDVAAGRFGDARKLLGKIVPAAPRDFVTQTAALVDEAEATSLWSTVKSDDDAARRLAACEDLARLPDSLPPPRRGEVAVTAETIGRTCDGIRRTEEARRARLQREEEARQARERREAERQARLERAAAEREERARERALRAWAAAPLRCRDGTLSPSCRCGSSSHRGCCSWHGGVSGCSQDYPSN